ncbi:MAG: cytochrome c-type biogenesis protein CcmH [Dehalococcoidales bacterium]|nr:cytochrome c-type biogenesis protein CcmH [Dehalococcoidales bacterium]
MTGNSVRKLFLPLLIALALVFTSCSSSVSAAEVNAVAANVNCVCGACDLRLVDCHCDKALEMQATIKKNLGRGQSQEQIIQGMAIQYGQRALVN